MDLIAHQKRLLELDNERHRLEDERRRRSVSKAHSTAGGAGSVSPSVSGVSLSPLPHREQQPHNVQSFALLERGDMADDGVATNRQQDLHHRHGAPASSSSPWGSQRVQHHQAASLQSSTALRYVSRSPSPILHLQSASPARGEESTHRVLRNAITGSSPQHRSSPGGSRWVPTAKGDQRFVCRELLVERGIDAKVLTGHDRAIPCKLHLSPNHQELLALPVDQSGGLMTESHHFPLRGAALLYPNGTIQHTWLPKRVHVSGVVVGNRAKSVLLSKGCPHFVSTARENRPRLYLVVGGDAYSDEATLLVLQFGSRLEWLCVLLGLHGAMWPDGKPPLTPGRALWLYACHAVTQLQWEANTTSDNLWHQSRRRSRSADPHKRLMADGSVPRLPLSNYRTSTPPPQQARAPPEQHYHQQPVLATPSSSGRFAVPLTPAASVSPPRQQPPSATNHVIISSNTSDARSTMVAPSQLSRAYPPSANRQVPSLAPYQQPGAQHQLQQRGRPVQVAPNQQRLATLPNGFTLVGSSASVASSTNQRVPPPPQHQQLQQPPPSASAPRTTFFPKSQSRQGGRQSVLQYGY